MSTANVGNRETDILEVIRKLEGVPQSTHEVSRKPAETPPDPVALKSRMVSNLERYRTLKNGGILFSPDDVDLEKRMEDAIKDLDEIIATNS